ALEQLPAGQVAILARAAFLVVAAERVHFEFAVPTGDAIAIRVPPWIDQSLLAFEVGSIPVRESGRRLYQGRKPDLLGRITAVLQIEQLKRRRNVLELDLSGLRARLPEVAENLRRRQGHDHDEDAQHHEQLEQSETGICRIRRCGARGPA